MTDSRGRRADHDRAPSRAPGARLRDLHRAAGRHLAVQPGGQRPAVLTRDQKEIAEIVDVPLTLIFLLDFTSRLLRPKPKRVYFIEQTRLARPARQPAVVLPAVPDLPPRPGDPPAGRVRRPQHRPIVHQESRRQRSDRRPLPGPARPRVREHVRHVLRAAGSECEHQDRRRRGLVGIREHHDRRLRRPVPGHDGWPDDGRLRAGDRRRPVRRPLRVPCQFLPGTSGQGRAGEDGIGVRVQSTSSTGERAELLGMVEALEADINALRTRLAERPDGSSRQLTG